MKENDSFSIAFPAAGVRIVFMRITTAMAWYAIVADVWHGASSTIADDASADDIEAAIASLATSAVNTITPLTNPEATGDDLTALEADYQSQVMEQITTRIKRA